MVKCTRCGARYEEKVNYCAVCGAPVRKESGGKAKYVLIIAGILAAAGIIAFMVISGVFHKDEISGDSSESQIQTEAGAGDTEADGADEDNDDAYGGNDNAYQGNSYNGDEYILPGSDREYIKSSDLKMLTDEELTLARNEIYARRGRIFKDADIRAYFMAQSWYEGTIDPDDFTEDMLSSLEKSNVQKIKAEEESRGMWD